MFTAACANGASPVVWQLVSAQFTNGCTGAVPDVPPTAHKPPIILCSTARLLGHFVFALAQANSLGVLAPASGWATQDLQRPLRCVLFLTPPKKRGGGQAKIRQKPKGDLHSGFCLMATRAAPLSSYSAPGKAHVPHKSGFRALRVHALCQTVSKPFSRAALR